MTVAVAWTAMMQRKVSHPTVRIHEISAETRLPL